MAVNQNLPFYRLRHEFKGVMYPNFVLDSSIKRLRTFPVRSDDVWLLSFPKAGTHWMMEIVGLILSDGDPDQINRSLYSSTPEMINMDQPFPATREDEKIHPVNMSPFLDVVERAPSPRVMLDHLTLDLLPEDILKSKVIYTARNPKDSILSWFEFVKDDPVYSLTMDKTIEEFMNYTMNWGCWPKHVRQFWELRDHENVTFVFYEDLKKEPAKNIQKIASGIGHPLSDETLQRVVELSHIESQRKRFQKMAESGQENLVSNASGMYTFLNKGIVGRWKNHFTVAQNEAFDEWYQNIMADTDLSFTFE
ncbi:sulfotransferase 1C4-like [Strongylocentrotus purpuratus]|uniref:Sulfotransferase domain-containing protein n=1 Tax=Strongylocentrotus purpuratus TaxID=7668 RepID=A0A7M7PMB5_STRPU|nr:sulfotransferase 1C4-like [Strongylocentrotus purpuratus]